MYNKIIQKFNENRDLIMTGSIILLTIAVVRSRPNYVRDVFISEGAKELIVEFGNGSSNIFSLMK